MDLRVEQLVPGLVTSAEWEKEERIHKGGVDVLGRRGQLVWIQEPQTGVILQVRQPRRQASRHPWKPPAQGPAEVCFCGWEREAAHL